MSYDITIAAADSAAPALFWTTQWDDAERLGDWRVAAAAESGNPGGLEAGGQLASAVVLSLFTDRRAPSGWRPEVSDRRGWWGDAVPPEGEEAEETGSHLWLLANEVATAEIAAQARVYAEEALAWMVRDAVAARIVVTSGLIEDPIRGVWLDIAIYGRAGSLVYSSRFGRLWREL